MSRAVHIFHLFISLLWWWQFHRQSHAFTVTQRHCIIYNWFFVDFAFFNLFLDCMYNIHTHIMIDNTRFVVRARSENKPAFWIPSKNTKKKHTHQNRGIAIIIRLVRWVGVMISNKKKSRTSKVSIPLNLKFHSWIVLWIFSMRVIVTLQLQNKL